MATEDDLISTLVNQPSNEQRRAALSLCSLKTLRAAADLIGESYADSMTRKQATDALMSEYETEQ